MDTVAHPPRLWTRGFVTLCVIQFLVYACEGLLVASLPLHVVDLGGNAASVGLVIATFSVASIIVRPWFGAMADRRGEHPLLTGGGALLATGAGLLLLPALPVLVAVSAVRGAGWAAANTGGQTVLAHMAPIVRRAEASSYYGLFQNISLMALPSVGLWVYGISGFGAVVALAATCALGSTVLTQLAFEIPRPEGASANQVESKRRMPSLFEREMLVPALLIGTLFLTYTTSLAFVPLYGKSLGLNLENLSAYFATTAVAAILGRAVLARWMDRVGRGPALATGYVLGILGIAALLTAPMWGIPALFVGGILHTLCVAVVNPVATAVAIDRARPERRGAAMASFLVALQVGQGGGAAMWGFVVEALGFHAMYLGAAAFLGIGLAVTARTWNTTK